MSYSGAENAPNMAEIRIGEDGVHVQLEVYVGDLRLFERLIPDEWLKGMKVDRPDPKERIRRFAEEDLRILADGTIVIGSTGWTGGCAVPLDVFINTGQIRRGTICLGSGKRPLFLAGIDLPHIVQTGIHLPEKFGARRSMNAAKPSAASAE